MRFSDLFRFVLDFDVEKSEFCGQRLMKGLVVEIAFHVTQQFVSGLKGLRKYKELGELTNCKVLKDKWRNRLQIFLCKVFLC